MKLSYNPLVLILLSTILFSCESVSIDSSMLDTSIKVNARINNSQTRATDNNWDPGDLIGIYMLKSGSNLTASNLLHQNEKYTTEGSGNFAPASDAVDIKFPDNGAKVDFISYYPYKNNIGSNLKYPVNLSSQDDQSAINFLFSDNAKGLSRTDNEVGLRFTPQLTKILINLTGKPGVPLKDVRLTLRGVNIKGDFSFADKKFTNVTKGNVRMKTNNKGDRSEALVIPNDNMNGVALEVISNDLSYTHKLDNLAKIPSFESGTTYQLNISFDSDDVSISVIVNPSSTIKPWIEGPTEDIVLRNGTEVPSGGDENGDGSEDNPYSVSKAKSVEQERTVWVKGYIVGHYTGNTVKTFSNDIYSFDEVKETCVAIASSPNEQDGENTFPVFLKTGDMRNSLNLNDNKDILGEKVTIKGHIDKYYGTIGMNSTLDYKFGF